MSSKHSTSALRVLVPFKYLSTVPSGDDVEITGFSNNSQVAPCVISNTEPLRIWLLHCKVSPAVTFFAFLMAA
jgi:hypothetical protein